ncbi:hypothetical protein JOQ06_025003, partial [Pogonophryne albipinna]
MSYSSAVNVLQLQSNERGPERRPAGPPLPTTLQLSALLGSQLWLSEYSSSPREGGQRMFQKEKPIRGGPSSYSLWSTAETPSGQPQPPRLAACKSV